MTPTIKIFITGGTFDKEYNELNGKLYFKNTHMFDMLEMGKCRLNVDVETLMMVDSLEMTDHQRQYIVRRCSEHEGEQIIITHGTDTMVKTAQLLAQKIPDKTIMLTGAMIPIKFGSSDGLFNMGSAMSFVQTLPKDVYITMNGHFYHWDNVRKNKKLGIFEEIKHSNLEQ